MLPSLRFDVVFGCLDSGDLMFWVVSVAIQGSSLDFGSF